MQAMAFDLRNGFAHYSDERNGVSNHQPYDFYSTFYSAADKRKHQVSRHWPLCGEFTGDRWIPHTKGQ